MESIRIILSSCDKSFHNIQSFIKKQGKFIQYYLSGSRSITSGVSSILGSDTIPLSLTISLISLCELVLSTPGNLIKNNELAFTQITIFHVAIISNLPMSQNSFHTMHLSLHRFNSHLCFGQYGPYF